MVQGTASSITKFFVWLAGMLGVALIIAGLLLPETLLWRLQLFAGLWLLSLPLRAVLPCPHMPLARSLLGITIVLGLGFSAIALQLMRIQIFQADHTRQQAAAIFQPPAQQDAAPERIRPAERTSLGSNYTWPVTMTTPRRGAIFDRNEVLLAETRDGRRLYPDADQGAILGYNSRLFGSAGLEARFDSYLSGQASLSPTALLKTRLLGTPLRLKAADLHLTLDSGLQQAAQQALGTQAGAVVLIEPQSGAILALATYPRFDPNLLVLPEQASERDVAEAQAAWQALSNQQDSPLLNRATQGRYPPGSVIKTLTAAAALDSSTVSGPDGQVSCPNTLPTEAGAPPVVNAVPNLARSTGNPSDLRRVFAFSCNTAFAQLGLTLGPERFADYAARLGLVFADQSANAAPDLRDIPADVGTIASEAAFLQRPAALADTAYGQGQALVTPLDMANLVAAIGNDGVLMRPYLVQEARAGNEVLYRARPGEVRRFVSAEAARQMRDVMGTSVEIGYAAPVALPGVTIGAKTGTAETPGGAPHAWFIALAPLDAPRFAIAVIVENGGEGSRTALPVARQVLAAALGIEL